MSNPGTSFYIRVKPQEEGNHDGPAYEPVQHNLNVRKLRSRCGYSLLAAFLIAVVLWLFDPPAGHEPARTPDNMNAQLKFVVAVHRHGARSAIHTYEFEKDIDWEVEPGLLLDVGFRQAFKLGRHLKNRYWPTLNAESRSSVKCVSTDIDRTVDTAHGVLLGLYTDNETSLTEPDCGCRPENNTRSTPICAAKCIGVTPLNIPRVEIWDRKSGNEMVLRQGDVCTGFHEFSNELRATDKFQNTAESKFPSEIELARQIVGNSTVCIKKGKKCHELGIGDVAHMWGVVQCLREQQDANGGPYTSVEDVYNKFLPVNLWMWHKTRPSAIGPDVGGILLDQIINDLEEGVKRKPPASLRVDQLSPPNKGHLMLLYSAHDSTLGGLLTAMDVVDWSFPFFTSHIVFELYGPNDPTRKTDLNQHYIRILYDGQPLLVGSCDQEYCELPVFTQSMEHRRRKKEQCDRRYL